jgi:hypothetical protein
VDDSVFCRQFAIPLTGHARRIAQRRYLSSVLRGVSAAIDRQNPRSRCGERH